MQAPPVNLRFASPPDARKIAELHVACWRETYRDLLPDDLIASLSVDRREESWRRMLDEPAKSDDTRVILAEVDESLVGFGACGAQRTVSLVAAGYAGEIGAIYVLNAHHRRGIGKRLAGAMAADLLRRSYRGVALWVLQGNAQARHFYEWCDGTVVAAREDVRGPHVLAEVAYGWPEIASLSRRLND